MALKLTQFHDNIHHFYIVNLSVIENNNYIQSWLILH